jgi:hypothetical protein
MALNNRADGCVQVRHDLPPLFGVEAFRKRGGTDNVGEQDRDDPALVRGRQFSRELGFEGCQLLAKPRKSRVDDGIAERRALGFQDGHRLTQLL